VLTGLLPKDAFSITSRERASQIVDIVTVTKRLWHRLCYTGIHPAVEAGFWGISAQAAVRDLFRELDGSGAFIPVGSVEFRAWAGKCLNRDALIGINSACAEIKKIDPKFCYALPWDVSDGSDILRRQGVCSRLYAEQYKSFIAVVCGSTSKGAKTAPKAWWTSDLTTLCRSSNPWAQAVAGLRQQAGESLPDHSKAAGLSAADIRVHSRESNLNKINILRRGFETINPGDCAGDFESIVDDLFGSKLAAPDRAQVCIETIWRNQGSKRDAEFWAELLWNDALAARILDNRDVSLAIASKLASIVETTSWLPASRNSYLTLIAAGLLALPPGRSEDACSAQLMALLGACGTFEKRALSFHKGDPDAAALQLDKGYNAAKIMFAPTAGINIEQLSGLFEASTQFRLSSEASQASDKHGSNSENDVYADMAVFVFWANRDRRDALTHLCVDLSDLKRAVVAGIIGSALSPKIDEGELKLAIASVSELARKFSYQELHQLVPLLQVAGFRGQLTFEQFEPVPLALAKLVEQNATSATYRLCRNIVADSLLETPAT